MGNRMGQVDPVRFVGKVDSAQISKTRTIFVGGHGKISQRYDQKVSPLEERISFLENVLAEDDLMMSEDVKEDTMARLQKLKAGLVFLQPGGRTEVEAEESRDRIEDAVCTVKAAINEGGFVAGGGTALLQASLALDQFLTEASDTSEEYRFGIEAAKRACYAPFNRITQNAVGD